MKVDPDLVRQASQMLQSAGQAMQEGNTDRALMLTEQILGMIPNLVQVRELYAMTLNQLGRHDEALEQFDLTLRQATMDGAEASEASDPDALYTIGLAFKTLYGKLSWSEISPKLLQRCLGYWKIATRKRLDLAYLACTTLLEIGCYVEGREIFDNAWAERERRAKEHGVTDLKLRFVYGDTSVSNGIHGVPNLLTGIGHIGFLDHFVKGLRLGWFGDIKPVMLLKDSPVVNPYFLSRFEEDITFIRDPHVIAQHAPYAQALEIPLNTEMAINGERMWCMAAYGRIEAEWIRQKRSPVVSIPPSDQERGRLLLAQLGVPEDAWFVCLHVRDNAFKREAETCDINRGIENANNAPLTAFEQAVDAIIERGGWVLRMGAGDVLDLPFTRDRLIDYARSSVRSDFMDVFLVANCRMFLGSCSGLAQVAFAFDVPLVATNWTPPVMRPPVAKCLFLPKLLRERATGRLLTFTEAWTPPLGLAYRPELFDVCGIDVVDNTADETLAVTLEMLARLDGSDPGDNPEDARLREAYAALGGRMLSPLVDIGNNSLIGRDFLRKHASLLEDKP